MNQSQAIDAVYRMIPEMAASSPDAVLSKYAAEHDLTIAQLERLGNVFNTASTLITIEKDRNGIPSLVDVPGMVSKYAAVKGVAKSASSVFDEDMPAGPAQEKVASEHVEPTGNVPFVWKTPAQKRAASIVEDDIPARSRSLDFPRILETSLQLAALAREEMFGCFEAANGAARKIASGLVKTHNPDIQYSELVSDLIPRIGDAQAELVGSKIATAFKNQGIPISTPRTLQPALLSRDRTGYLDDAVSIWDNLKRASEIWDGASREALETIVEAVPHMRSDVKTLIRIHKEAKDTCNFGESFGLIKEAAANPAPERGNHSGNIVRGPWGPPDEYDSRVRDRMLAAEEAADAPIGSAMSVGNELLGAGYYSLLAGQRHLSDAAFNVAPKIMKEFGDEGAFGKMLERRYGDKNRKRVHNNAVELSRLEDDVKSMAMLQRLMITDEVLADKDPETVVEAYNSIRAASPEVAADPSMLRLMLRRALETQGLDIDSATAARKHELGSFKGDPPPRAIAPEPLAFPRR